MIGSIYSQKGVDRMNKYEKLTAEFEDEVIIEERPIKNIGLYSGGIVWLRDEIYWIKLLWTIRGRNSEPENGHMKR